MSTDRQRADLAARQRQVLDDLLAGRVPDGFEPRSAAATGLVLRRKRWRAALRAVPSLTQVPGGRDLFDDYAQERPAAGCGHDDADAFLDWAARRGRLDLAGDAVRRRRLVESGVRRLVLVRHPRRALLVALGDWVHQVPLGR